MDICTQFEDLSNEIFFEILDYLDALNIFAAFTSLNQRISLILQSIPLRVIISNNYCRNEVDYLSSNLIFHAHQVVSLEIYDTICDDSSMVSLLFYQHQFINLQSCIFHDINPLTKLETAIKQIQISNRLVSFTILQTEDNHLNEKIKAYLTRSILMHPLSLRSIVLQYPYDYSDIFNYTSVSSHLTSLELIISCLPTTKLLYSILPILRFCHTVRCLRLTLVHKKSLENVLNDSIQLSTINDNDLPILTQLIFFDITIRTKCNGDSIASVLRCMPNLKQFYFNFIHKTMSPFPDELLDGYVWKQMLEFYVPYLSKFEFHMSIVKKYPKLDLDIVIKSFEYFVGKYSNWNMIIDRWQYNVENQKEFIMLCTLNYHKDKPNSDTFINCLYCRSFQTRSTTTINNHHLFYPDQKRLLIYITKTRPTVTWSSPLFQQINDLFIETPIIPSSLWSNLWNMVTLSQTTDNEDAKQCATYLANFVHLPNITRIAFGLAFDTCRWKDIQFILQACPNLTGLKIDTRLVLYSKLIDNPCLISIFKQIKILVLKSENYYFPSYYASKFVEHFPSLNHVELQVFSFDNCVSVIDIFLRHLKNIYYIKITYSQDTLLNDPFSQDYVINKRRQAFPIDIMDEQMIVDVKNNGEAVEIILLS